MKNPSRVALQDIPKPVALTTDTFTNEDAGLSEFRPLPYPCRIVTATTLFDGHDVAINMIRRLLQASGVEVIHLGHNRSVEEIVNCAIQEDAQAIAVTSYQGGHMEFFRYMYDLLQQQHAPHIRIFGGGATILPAEKEALHQYGIAHIYSPDESREMGLQGMIDHLVYACSSQLVPAMPVEMKAPGERKNNRFLASLITSALHFPGMHTCLESMLAATGNNKPVPVLGITGPGGAGKSSLIDELIRCFMLQHKDKHVAVICTDPGRKKTGGALLGDRIRINMADNPNVYIRSIAVRSPEQPCNRELELVIDICKAAAFDLIIVETPGTGQSETAIAEIADVCLYVMTSEYGSPSQLEKISMLDYADVVAINKFDKHISMDALSQVRRQYKRNHCLWNIPNDDLPVVGTNAAIYNDTGVHRLYQLVMKRIREKTGCPGSPNGHSNGVSIREQIIPPSRSGYLHEIVETLCDYNRMVEEQVDIARKLYQLNGTRKVLEQRSCEEPTKGIVLEQIRAAENQLSRQLGPGIKQIIDGWQEHIQPCRQEPAQWKNNGKVGLNGMFFKTLSHLTIPKVSAPKFEDWGEIVRWSMQENLPGFFPFTAGVFEMKREEEESTRLTAGEGGAERSNRRFHYLTKGMKGKRISTAHDSVTLYGFDPACRPDIIGKIGSTGVSISHLDDTKILYSGFNLADQSTSVNLTINGPSPMILAFFLNTAIDQQCELYIHRNGLLEDVSKKIEAKYAGIGSEKPVYKGILPARHDRLGLLLLGVTGDEVLPAEIYSKIKSETLQKLRGTVQCDILKEDQAQNTCIFSTLFSLKMMADMQEYFIEKKIRHFYSVSVSGYHIAEAGANPVTQIAFTLANGFTYIEYYLSKGMKIDEFVPHFSFFFSTGLDAEYMVLGRVARRIWAKVLKSRYGANERSQKLKYHIQTSGRSLHAQEIGFNDIRTTLQALVALNDNCNSLHTNANDEALSLPTETSVRKAIAIQKIIEKEFGLSKNQNPSQGSFIIEELTNLVEEAVIRELHNLARRGGVLAAMEMGYQRSKIQEESMHYETLKHNGMLPIVGVNTFINEDGSPTIIPEGVVRISQEEIHAIIEANCSFKAAHQLQSGIALHQLQMAVENNRNIFECLMEASKCCTLGQMTDMLFSLGGRYRRNT